MCNLLGNFTGGEHACLLDPSRCIYGFSLALWVNIGWETFRRDVSDGRRSTFISAGDGSTAGFSVYQDGFHTIAEVRNETVQWRTSVFRQVKWNNWTNIALRWNEENGLQFFIDGKTAAIDQEGELHGMQLNASSDVLLGCQLNSTGEADAFQDHASATVDELAIWLWRLRDQERPFYMGGHIPRPTPLYTPPVAVTTEDPTAITQSTEQFFDYVNDVIQIVSPSAGNEEENPMFLAAGSFWSFNETNEAFSHRISRISGWGNTGSAISLSSNESYYKLGNTGYRCTGDVTLCADGLSVGFWLMLPSSVAVTSQPQVVLLSGGQRELSTGYGVFIINGELVLAVSNGIATSWNEKIPLSALSRLQWFHISFTWHNLRGLQVYVNWKIVSTTSGSTLTLKEVMSGCILPEGLTIAGCEMGSSIEYTLQGLSLDDVVVWERYLYDWELYRFKGHTYDEDHFIQESDYYWSIDPYTNRYLGNNGSMLPLYTPHDSLIQWVPGRGQKAKAPRVTPNERGWVMLAPESQAGVNTGWFKETHGCLTDPSLCPAGLSLGLWIQPFSLSDTGRRYIVSSGEHHEQSVGISLYLYEGKIAAAVSDGFTYWKSMSQEPLQLGEWVHVGFSWTSKDGLRLYQNGETVALNSNGQTQRRTTNQMKRVMLGRANDDYDFKDFGDFAFEDIAVMKIFMDEPHFRKKFHLPETRQYSSASALWDRDALVTSHSDRLMSTPDPSYLGPHGNFSLTEQGVLLNASSDGHTANIVLGHMEEQCNINPSGCEQGLSASVWLKVVSPAEDFHILRSSDDISKAGFYIGMTNWHLCFEIRTEAKRWRCVDQEQYNSTRWGNIGLIWSEGNGLKGLVNGLPRCADQIAESLSSPISQGQIILGVKLQDGVNDMQLEIGTVALWAKELQSGHHGALMGVTDTKASTFRESSIFCPFEGPIQRYSCSAAPEPDPQTLTHDRYEYGSMVRREIYDSGAISLGDMRGECLVDPSQCTTDLVIGMWILMKAGEKGYIFKAGSSDTDSRGVVFKQDKNVIRTYLSDGYKHWLTEVRLEDADFERWFYLMMIWNRDSGLAMYIDNVLVAHSRNFADGVVAPRPAALDANIYLAQEQSYTDFVTAYFDDIVISHDQEPMSLGGCYESADTVHSSLGRQDIMVPGIKAIQDRHKNKNAAVLTENSKINLGTKSSPAACPTDPSACENGFTIAIWVNIKQYLESATSVILSLGLPDARGFSITIEDTFNSSMSLVYSVHDGNNSWQVITSPPQLDEWINMGMTWSNDLGLQTYINGNLTGVSTEADYRTTRPQAASALHIGAREDGRQGIQQAAFDDIALWLRDLSSDPEVSDILSGRECSPPIVHPKMYNDSVLYSGEYFEKCPIIVGGICINDISSLHDYLTGNITLSTELIRDALRKLYNDTKPERNVLTEADLERVTGSFGDIVEMLIESLPPDRTLTEAQEDMHLLSGIAENLLFPLLYDAKWENVNAGDGVAHIVKQLEKSVLHVTDSIKLEPYDPSVKIHSARKNLYCFGEKRNLNIRKTEYMFPDFTSANDVVNQTISLWKKPFDSITISHDLLTQAANQSDTITISSILFDTLQDVMPKYANGGEEETSEKNKVAEQTNVNSRVVSTSVLPMEPNGGKFKGERVKLTFYPKQNYDHKKTNIRCSFWEHKQQGQETGSWRTEGCEMGKHTPDEISCHCDHLTSFAIIASPIEEKPDAAHQESQKVIMYIGIALSTMAIIGFIYVIAKYPKKENDQHLILRNACGSNVFMLLMMMMAEGVSEEASGRGVISIFLHCLFIANNSWLLCEAVALLLAITHEVSYGCFKIYIPLSWSVSILPVIISACVDFDAFGTSPHCWVSYHSNVLWGFIVLNVLILGTGLCVTIVALRKSTSKIASDVPDISDVKAGLKNNLALHILLVVPWILGMAFYDRGDDDSSGFIFLDYLFIIFYSTQGFFFALLHTIGIPHFRHIMRCNGKQYKSKPGEKGGKSEAGPSSFRKSPRRPPSPELQEIDI